jgi:hypothetical protein
MNHQRKERQTQRQKNSLILTPQLPQNARNGKSLLNSEDLRTHLDRGMMTQTAQIFGRHKVHLKADKVVVKVELQGCRISSGTFNGRAGCGCEQKLAKLLEPLLKIGN